MKLTLEITVERNDAEIELALECSYSPSKPDGYMEPGDPETFEVSTAADERGKLYELTPEEEERAFLLAREKYADLTTADEP